MIVDSHIHVVSEDERAYPFAAISLGGAADHPWYREAPIPTVERQLDLMAATGVDRAIVVQPFSAYGYDCSYHADSAARYPDRFIGICTADPLAADGPDRLSYWIRERGMQGLRLNAVQASQALDDPRAFPLWERAGALGIPICVLTTADHLGQVRNMAARFPTVRIALDHLADMAGHSLEPPALQQLLGLAELPNVYLKYSTVNLGPLGLDAGEQALAPFRSLVERFGPRRMIWGTNYPFSREMPYADMLDLGRRALPFLTDEDRRWMLGDTAVSLWPKLKAAAK